MSKGEKLLAQILREEFPFYHIEEQYPIKIGWHTTLYLDFYIPKVKLCIEVDGRQHNQYVPFFHRDKQGYQDSKHRDRLKEQWCEDHDVRVIRLTQVTKEELRRRLLELGEEKN